MRFGGGDVIDIVTAAELDELAARIARIKPMSNSNPHAFYEERSEVAGRIRELAVRLRTRTLALPAEAAEVPATAGGQAQRKRVVHVHGRTVLVLERSSRPLAASWAT